MAKDSISEIYSDSASLGVFLVSVSVLLSIIVSVVAILYSILLMLQPSPYDKSVQGDVVISECIHLSSGLTRCSYDVAYTVDNKPYLLSHELDVKTPIKVGDKVTVKYDQDRPDDSIVGPTPRQTGYMLLGSGLSILLVAIVSLWLVRRFKIVAAASGVSGILGLF